MKGKLWIVPTPIGNLEDMTRRASRILREADVIYCEDTRHSARLFAHEGIEKPLVSLHKWNEASRVDEVYRRLLDGENIAVVSDAGMPGISDPVERLVSSLLERDTSLEISALPGACAAICALVSSGLSAERFLFVGFLPSRQGDRKRALADLANRPETMIFYEAPHRMREMLSDMFDVFGDRRLSIAREISKVHEQHLRMCLSEAVRVENWRGEIAVVCEGAPPAAADFRPLAERIFSEGIGVRKTAALVAEILPGTKKNEIYAFLLELDAKER